MSTTPADVRRHLSIGRDAHRRLLAVLGDLLDDGRLDPDAPTRLGGWTQSMLITHLARNADSHRRLIEGAASGEVLDQYEGGLADRNDGIEAGRGLDAADVVDDLRGATGALEAAWADTDWQGFGRRSRERLTPITELVFLRIREVELHHVDLDVGTTFDDLDPTYVRLELARLTMLWTARQPMGMTTLPGEVLALSPGDRLAWLTGRRDVEGVDPVPQLF